MIIIIMNMRWNEVKVTDLVINIEFSEYIMNVNITQIGLSVD